MRNMLTALRGLRLQCSGAQSYPAAGSALGRAFAAPSSSVEDTCSRPARPTSTPQAYTQPRWVSAASTRHNAATAANRTSQPMLLNQLWPMSVSIGAPLSITMIQLRAAATTTDQEKAVDMMDDVQSARSPQERSTALAELLDNIQTQESLLEQGVLSGVEPEAHEMLTHLSQELQRDPKAHKLTAAQAAHILSICVLSSHFDVKLKDLLVDLLLSDAPNAPPGAFAEMCYAMGLGGYHDRQFMSGLERVMTDRGDQFTIKQMAICLWFLGRVGWQTPTVHSLLAEMQARLSCSKDPVELVYGLWAADCFAVTDDDLLNRSLEIVMPQLETLKAAELGKFALSLVHYSIDDVAIFQKLKQQAMDSVESFYPRDIAKMFYALGLANAFDRELLHKMEPTIESYIPRFTKIELDMLMQAYNRGGYHTSTAQKVADIGTV